MGPRAWRRVHNRDRKCRRHRRVVSGTERGLGAVGVNNNTNFLRSMVAGRVIIDTTPLQQGRTQQLWEFRIVDEQGHLVATGQGAAAERHAANVSSQPWLHPWEHASTAVPRSRATSTGWETIAT